MKVKKILLPVSLVLVLVVVFVGSIFLGKAVQNNLSDIKDEIALIEEPSSIKEIKINYSEARLFDCLVTVSGKDVNVSVKLNEDGSFVILENDLNLSEEDSEMIITDVKKKAKNYIDKIEGNLVHVHVMGYSPITVIFDITDGQIKVNSFDQNESYQYNSGYSPENGDPFEIFEDKINNNQSLEDVNISGATVTTNGLKESYKIIQEYMAYLGGGNNE